MNPRTRMQSLALVVLLVLGAGGILGGSTSAAPVVVPGPSATRTLVWSFDAPDDLFLENATLNDGMATLPWAAAGFAWARGPDFLTNGSADATVEAVEEGLVLAADERAYVESGGFDVPAPWTYENGTAGAVTASWNPTDRVARLAHDSPEVPTSPFDALDDAVSTWRGVSEVDLSVVVSNYSWQPIEGTGMMQAEIRLGSSPAFSIGPERKPTASPVDWSGFDTLLVWIRSPAAPGLEVSFNVTAFAGPAFVATTPIPLRPEWQRVLVDLDELGPARTALTQVTLLFTGRNTPEDVLTFYVDDLRLANAKRVDETARLSQVFGKTKWTTAAPGGATLGFDYRVLNASGADAVELSATLSDGGAWMAWALPSAPSSGTRFEREVGAFVAAPGTYSVFFDLHVAVATPSAVNVTALLDNVSLEIPDRRNGSFVSSTIDLGSLVSLASVAWEASLPTGTSARLEVRMGSTPVPDDGWVLAVGTTPGPLVVADSARFVRVRADLNTTNASVTPLLTTFRIEAERHPDRGAILTSTVSADADFLFWRRFEAVASTPEGTGVAYEIEDATGWRMATPGGNLSAVQGRTVRLRATLSTSDPLEAPAIDEVRVVYDYLGTPIRLRVWADGDLRAPVGGAIQFHATVLDAGNHTSPAWVVYWATDNPGGHVNVTGYFVAGEPGVWNVTASTPFLSERLRVTVTAVPFDVARLIVNPLVIAMAVLVGTGYLAYRYAGRRLFSVEDVFLVARDGRLILHNTRRMRADRDEDILAAMLTAISAFVRDISKEEDGHLRRFDFAGKTVLVERGKDVFVAAMYRGRVPRWSAKGLRAFLTDLESAHGAALATWTGSPEDLAGLKELTDRFVAHTKYRRMRNRAS